MRSKARAARRARKAFGPATIVFVVAVASSSFALATNASPGATAKAGNMRIAAIWPASGAQRVVGTASIRVRFSTPIDPHSPRPTLSPPVPGHWTIAGRTLTFAPSGAYPPDAHITVTIPAGPRGMKSTSGSRLRSVSTIGFDVASGSVLRAEQLLSGLGYLPVAWRQHRPIVRGVAAFERAAFVPPPGRFVFLGDAPPELQALWRPGVATPILTAALAAFDQREGLPAGGQLTAKFWDVLLRIGYHAAAFAVPDGFTYALVSKQLPESLTIIQNGRVVLETPANTGIPQSPTPDGTYAVYLRYQNQVMSGTSPWGTKYSDPVSWVAYFNGSDAVHYIYRASYGYPQSFGCVEVPLAAAERAWGYLTLGTLVTVTG